MLEKLDESVQVVRLCEQALGVIEAAAETASNQGLLNHVPHPGLSNLLGVGGSAAVGDAQGDISCKTSYTLIMHKLFARLMK